MYGVSNAYPATSPYAEEFNVRFDLTLLKAKYVFPTVVSDDWNPKLYPGDSSQYTDDDFHWALTEGNDIYVVHIHEDGTAIRPGEKELSDPKPHGSEIIWRSNDDGLSRTIIGVYDKDFQLMAQYYLEITEIDGDYYAEIVKIVQ